MLTIDGSTGEGGGQILRTSLSLSMITGQPVRIEHIRARRPKPGLMRQHLACVLAAQAMSGAQVSGAELGSQTLVFEPGALRPGEHAFAIGSAGSCLLVLQTVLPALMLAPAPSQLKLSGGTHNPLAPTFHFVERAFLPQLARLGVKVEVTLRRHGFYPAGGGEMLALIEPAVGGLRPFDLLDRGAVGEAFAESLVAAVPRRVAERELSLLKDALGWDEGQLRVPNVRQNEGPGNALIATLAFEHVTEVFTSFGEKSVSSEQVASRLLRQVKAYQDSTAAAGPYLADQLALPWALAVHQGGQAAAYSCSEITEHTRTNLDVIQRFLPVVADVTREGAHRWRVAWTPHQT
ncbi:RNA 3'-terminal phosphate cyclase (ATP) [Hydrogenophaga palleronii]|uniref:RNA 3'-terminal phosphate cyclase n=1 Tax=Hydrogenophaga palleronii TaxID=65655 RepID=A0ABU1WSI9_9BURK|nr:RNA 3'-terminal phosphate cyclase [Hydrogenophaga palleronii]MDR7152260.1 RNA 3'-terminal phosphate cyclase (ATP) [Hydrogenophaga palleronii]